VAFAAADAGSFTAPDMPVDVFVVNWFVEVLRVKSCNYLMVG
jgi:hypothetical protein